MQRFSTWARWIATAIFIPIFTAIAARFIWEQPTETANVVLKFLLYFGEQTWLHAAAWAFGGFVAGFWLDWFLRKVDGSRADKRKALGTEMLDLGNKLTAMKYPIDQVRPQILSYFAAVRKFGIWVPDDRIFSIHTKRLMDAVRSGGSFMEPTPEVFDSMKLDDMITDYLKHVGTMLKDGNFREAKQYAKKSKADFDKIV